MPRVGRLARHELRLHVVVAAHNGIRLLLERCDCIAVEPLVVKQMFETIKGINEQGTTVLLAEQNAFAALKIAHRAYVIENGRLVMEGDKDAMLGNEEIRKAYIGA